jgi:hypothetical protein
MRPGITDTVLDGQLGALPQSSGLPYIVMGPCAAGDQNTPAAYARKQSFAQNYVAGPAVELAAKSVEETNVPCIFIRTLASVVGSAGAAVQAADGECSAVTVTRSGASTFVPSIDTGPKPNGIHTVWIRFAVGGNLGTTGMIYQVSTNGGASYGFALALGVAKEIDLTALIGAVTVILDTGTESIGAGDIVKFTTTAPVLASDGMLNDDAVAGTAEITISTSGGTPNDDYVAAVRIVHGGEAGSDTDITYQWCLDYYSASPTWSVVTALGSATSITIPGAGGWSYLIGGADPVVEDGDLWFSLTTAPAMNSSDLTTALAAVTAMRRPWNGLIIASPIDSTLFGVLESWLSARSLAGDPQRAVTYWRLPTPGESRSAYLTAFAAAMGSLSSAEGKIVLGGRSCCCVSAVSGRDYRRPNIWGIAAKLFTVSPEIDVAQIDPPGGAIAGVTIRDANGNVRDHDEDYEPGDDDERMFALRTWNEFEGVYVNRPRTFCPRGSDFVLLPRGRVFDLCRKINRAYFLRLLSRGVPANATTGYIREDVARKWESGAQKSIWGVIGGVPMASSVNVIIWRTDNLLPEGAVMHVEFRMGPLVYVEQIGITSAMRNPALGG